MRVFRHFTDIPIDARGAVLAVGNFDGVHRGHQAVIRRAAEEAARLDRPFGVVTFEPHPRQVFAPATPPFRLTPFRAKMRELEALGCGLTVSLHFDRTFAEHSAEHFADTVLHRGLGAAHVVVGYDFVFGKGRRGNATVLQAMGAELGFGVTIVAPAGDGSGEAISSTQIRDRLKAGDPRSAAALLGRAWTIDGRVQHGDAIGRTIGFPTANIDLGEYLRPASGIYAVRAGIEGTDGVTWHDAVASLGTRPTVGGVDLRFETHLIDFSGDLYGRHMRIMLVEWLRAEEKYPTLDEMTTQIGQDVAAARRVLSHDRDPFI